MLQSILAMLRIRVLVVFLLVHAGLALGIFGLARVSYPNGWDETSILLLISVLFLYGGFLLSVLFVLLPLLPWVRRAQRVEHWSERLLDDLPQIIAAFQSLLAAWNESRVKANKNSPTKSQ